MIENQANSEVENELSQAILKYIIHKIKTSNQGYVGIKLDLEILINKTLSGFENDMINVLREKERECLKK